MMRESPLTVRLVQSDADRDACYALRMRVFVDEQGVPPWEEVDDETRLPTICSVLVAKSLARPGLYKGEGVGKIGRVAVEVGARGQGAGRDLMLAVIAHGFDRFDTLILDAQLQVFASMRDSGFQANGPVFLDAGIEHRFMRRTKEPILLKCQIDS